MTESRRPARYAWYVVILLAAVNLFNTMDRLVLSVLLPSIKVELALSDGQLGLLTGFGFALFYAVCGIPIARWADRHARAHVVALALATWSLMTALCGAANSYWQLLLARVGVGIGESGGMTPASSLLCDYVPLKRRVSAFGIQNLGQIVGLLAGLALAGWLAETIGWRMTFMVVGVPGVALALLVRMTLREPPRGRYDAFKPEESPLSLAQTFRALWRIKTYRLLLFSFVTTGFAQYGLNQWWPSFYTRVMGLSLTHVGLYLGLALGVGYGVAALINIFWMDKVAQKDIKRPLLICAGLAVGAIPISVASLFVPTVGGSLLLVAIAGLLWNVGSGPVMAALYSVVHPGMRATAGAVMVMGSALLGMGLGPLAVGLVSDLLSPALGAESLRFALLVPMSALPLMALAQYRAAHSLTEDLVQNK